MSIKYFALLLLTLFPAQTFAAVTVTFVETGSPTADDEYIVIKNTSDHPRDISSWSLQAKNSGSATIHKKNFMNGTIIAPQDEYIVAHKNGRFAGQAHMTYTSLALSASGGTLALNTSQNYANSFEDATIASSFHYGASTTSTSTSQQDKTKPETIEPKAVTSVQEFIGTISTTEKILPIQINELLPRPSNNEEEYIEIINNSSVGVDISGLWLRDASGAAYALGSRGENSVLGAYETRAWKRSVTRIALNDTDGEVINLINQNGTILDRVVYTDDALIGVAYARFKSSWLWTQTTTPSLPNYLTLLQTPPIARAVIPKLHVLINEKISVSAEDSTDTNDLIKEYRWNFGREAELFGVTSTYAFMTSGTHVIALTVTDSYGASTTVSKAVTVHTPPSLKISAAATRTTSAPKKRVVSNPYYTGIVSVPPGLLGKRKFVVNGRTVEVTSDRQEIPRLKHGTVIRFTASEVFRTDRLILQISSKDSLKITGLSTTPPYDTRVGEIIRTSKNGFDLATTSTDYAVIAGTKYADGKRIQVGDKIEMQGVLLHDDASTPYFIIPAAKHLTLIKRQAESSNLPRDNILMLSGTIGLLILLQLFLTRYGSSIHNKLRNRKKIET